MVWKRWFSSFAWFINERQLEKDLDQTIELISLEAKQYSTVKEVGAYAQKYFRAFLRSNGMVKGKDRYKLVGELVDNEIWRMYCDTGKFIETVNSGKPL